MKKPIMCMPLLVKRLAELNEQLATIAKLQKMEGEYDRNPAIHSKKCDCSHHKLPTGDDQKRIPCNVNTCKAKKKYTCLCKCNKARMEVLEKQDEEIKGGIDIREEMRTDETKQVSGTRFAVSQNLEKLDNMSGTKDTSVKTNIKNENENIHKMNNVERISTEISMGDDGKSKTTEGIATLHKENGLTNEKIKKKDEEYQIPYLTETLKEVEEQLGRARREIDTITADRDRLLQTVSKLKEELDNISSKNVSLNCQCKDLKYKLQTISENETKSCTVVQDEVNHIKSISKQKEEILQAEITELKGLITELTNVTKIQERRICELTNVCKKQQCSLHKKNKLLVEKGCQIAEMQSLLNSYSCKCTEMQNDIINLQTSLNKESHVCKHLKEELERYKDDYNCMLNIKTKIIEEQDETIKKQKRLLQDSERMAQQAASEFEEIRNELVQEKETCESLKFALLTTEAQLTQRQNVECKNCQNLMVELSVLDQQKQKALAATKNAFQKLCTSVRYFQKQLASERQQCKFLTLKLKEKQEEVEYVKEEVAHRKKMIMRRTSDFLS